MSLSWKLLPFVTVLLVALAMATWPAGRGAEATPLTVTVSPIVAGQTFTVIATYNNMPGPGVATLTASGSGVFSQATAVSNGAGAGVGTTSGPNSNTIFVPAQSGGTSSDIITVTATFVCNTQGSVIFTLTHAGNPASVSSLTPVSCGAAPGIGTATINVTPSLVPVGGQAVAIVSYQGTPSAQMVLQASGAGFFGIPSQFTPDSPPQFIGQNTAFLSWTNPGAGPKSLQVLFTCAAPGNVFFSLTQGGSPIGQAPIPLNCGTGLATPTPTVGLASQVSVAASPSSVNCNGTAFVTITVRNAAGTFVADGTSVSLTTNTGSLSPTTATTLGGGVLAVYTAPSNSGGSASITAAAGGASGSGTITVNCSSATPTPAPAAPPPPPQPAQTFVSPPNTGSAGLQSAGDARPYLGLILLAATLLVVAALRRVRS